MECGDRSRRFAVRQPQLPLSHTRRELRLAQGKAAAAAAALQNAGSMRRAKRGGKRSAGLRPAGPPPSRRRASETLAERPARCRRSKCA